MKPPSVWALLGIEATRDRAVIRRAYAARLRKTNPEDDAIGFQALREAYELALAYAGSAGGASDAASSPPHPAARGRTPEQDSAPAEEPSANAQVDDQRAGRGRDWRPHEPSTSGPGPERPPGRVRAWRPAPAPVSVEVFDASERQAFAEARDALARLVADPRATDAARMEGLRAMLASPLMDDVARHDETAAWLARLVAANAPRADCLIDAIVACFHWDEHLRGPGSAAAGLVLARREDLRFLAATGEIGNPLHGAYQALSRRPARWRLVAIRLTPGLAGRVGRLLTLIRTERPRLMVSLDPEAVAWWERHLSRPRLGPVAIWLIVLAPAGLALAAQWGNEDDPSRFTRLSPGDVYLGGLIAIVSAVAINLYAIDWPRHLWRRRWAHASPRWVTVSWAPALSATLLAAALAPPSPTTTLTLAALSAPMLLWAVVVGEPDRRQTGEPSPVLRWRGPTSVYPLVGGIYAAYRGLFRPGVRFPWQVRAAFAYVYLAIVWLTLDGALPAGAWRQMSPPLAAVGVAFVAGAATLRSGWRSLTDRKRLAGVAALGFVALVALAAIGAASELAVARPLAAALVALAVLAHKTPAADLGRGGWMLRDVVMRYGWLPLYGVAGQPDMSVLIGFYSLLFATGLVGGAGALRPGARLKPGERTRALRRLTGGVTRYGWIAGAPLLLTGLLGTDSALLAAGGVWLLTGVAVTVAGLVPAPRGARA